MGGQPPQLRDQAGFRWGLRIGGALLAAIGLILVIVGAISFFATFDSVWDSIGKHSVSVKPPRHVWMLFVGQPLLILGAAMLAWGFFGTTARYTAGEVMPTVKDSLGYVGVGAGAHETACAKCGAPNAADARFCARCGSAVSVSCASCGHANPPDAAFCSACGKPLTAS